MKKVNNTFVGKRRVIDFHCIDKIFLPSFHHSLLFVILLLHHHHHHRNLEWNRLRTTQDYYSTRSYDCQTTKQNKKQTKKKEEEEEEETTD